MINIFVTPESIILKPEFEVPAGKYLCCALSPDIPHVEKNDGTFHRYYAVMIDKNLFENTYFEYSKKSIPELFWKQFLLSNSILFYLRQFISEYETACNKAHLYSLAVVIAHSLIKAILNME